MITIKSTEWIMDKNGEITGLPMFGGKLTFCKITDVAGDEPGEDGHRTLTYNPDGTLAKNYILCFINGSGNSSFIGDAAALVDLCNFMPEDVSILDKWFHDLSGIGSGIPVTVTDVEISGGVNAIVLGNLYEYYKEMELEEIAAAFQAKVADGSTSPNDRVDEESLRNWAKGVGFVPTCTRLQQMYRDIGANCESDMYVRSVLAKLGGIIQKRYNIIHFDMVADEMANQISQITFFDNNGKIVHLSISMLEGFIERIKSRISLDPMAGIVSESPEEAYKNF